MEYLIDFVKGSCNTTLIILVCVLSIISLLLLITLIIIGNRYMVLTSYTLKLNIKDTEFKFDRNRDKEILYLRNVIEDYQKENAKLKNHVFRQKILAALTVIVVILAIIYFRFKTFPINSARDSSEKPTT